MSGLLSRPGNSSQFIARGIVPGNVRFTKPQFAPFSEAQWNLLKRKASSILEPCQRVSCRPRFDFHRSAGDISMTITAVQIPAIVALLAGVLILIMPRFLNFIVAIYLILVGLHGLGIFRSLHM
jgi:Protein of unknown function (DUF3096)